VAVGVDWDSSFCYVHPGCRWRKGKGVLVVTACFLGGWGGGCDGNGGLVVLGKKKKDDIYKPDISGINHDHFLFSHTHAHKNA
jgi:hypothetical protein